MILGFENEDSFESFKKEVLKLYTEYHTVYGPYKRKSDNRIFLNLKMGNGPDNKSSSYLLAKLRLEIHLGRRLVDNEAVDHEDEDSTNDDISNLKILTRVENARKSAKGNKHCLGRKQNEDHKRSGQKNGMAKFSDEEIEYYRKAFRDKELTVKDIVMKTSSTEKTVRKFLAGVTYKSAKMY